MPREVVLQKFCDACFADGSQMVTAVATWTVGANEAESPPALHMLDVCETHGKMFEELSTLLSTSPPFKRSAPLAAPKPVENKREPGQVRCPVCQDDFNGRSILVNHIWTIHRPMDRRVSGQAGKCPDCPEVFPTPQGFAAHRRIAHEWSAVDEALSGVKGFRLIKN